MLFPRWFGSTVLSVGAALFACFALAGCDGDGSSDTGYGAGEPVPETINCTDSCRRISNCMVHLCTEDTGSNLYLDAASLEQSMCESGCKPSDLTSRVTSTMWACLFKSSCRRVFENDACHVKAYYHCQ
jgi:hypothetical protein